MKSTSLLVVILLVLIFFSPDNCVPIYAQPVNEPDAGFIKTYMQKGDSLMNDGEYSLAILSFSNVINYNPEHYKARRNRADCYIRMSNYLQAKADLNYLIKHNKKDHSLLKAKAKLFYSMGDIYGAETILDIYVEKVPDDPEGWYLLGLMEKKSERFRSALYHLDKANTMYGGNYYESLTVMGNIYKAKKEYEIAEKHYRLAIRADSMQGLPYYLIGDLRLLQYDTVATLDYYDTAISINVNDNFVADLVTKSLLSMGYIDLAIKKYESQIKEDPYSAQAWSNLGIFYLCVERYGQALDCFDQALIYDPDQSQLFYYKGIALIGLDNKESGRSYIKESARMGNFHAQQYIAMPAKKGLKAGLQTWVITLQILQLLKL